MGTVHRAVRARLYASLMRRNAWIMAASLIERHGMDALTVVSQKLNELNLSHLSGTFADGDAAAMRFCRETGVAALAIVQPEPSGPYSVN